MKQCAARQFENELVERLSILANRHLRPPAPERGPHSIAEKNVLHVIYFSNIFLNNIFVYYKVGLFGFIFISVFCEIVENELLNT